MIEIYLGTIKGDLTIPIYLEKDIGLNGVLVDADAYLTNQRYDNLIIKNTASTYDLKSLTDYFKNNKCITGTTTSKLQSLLKEGDTSEKIKDLIKIPNNILPIYGTENYGLIENYIEIGTGYTATYYLYVNQETPIKYTDNLGVTTFEYKPNDDQLNKTTFNLFTNIAEEPKIVSNVFIDRGVNNVYEPIVKLSKVKSVRELKKIGSGYFKINKGGLLV